MPASRQTGARNRNHRGTASLPTTCACPSFYSYLARFSNDLKIQVVQHDSAIARPTIRLGGRYPQTEDYNEWFYLQAERTLCCALTFRPALSQSLSPRIVDLEIIELLPALDSSTKCLVVLDGKRQTGQHLLAVNISQFDPMPT